MKVIANDSCWIEGDALRQLEQTAALEDMLRVVGLPDLHPGKGGPVGAAFLSKSRVYPALVGSDIGCGMSLTETDVDAKKLKIDRWEKKLLAADLDTPSGDRGLGTIGSGNHFAELCVVDEVVESGVVDAARVQLIVHSGSRGLGERILRAHTQAHGANGADASTDEGRAYLDAHHSAVAWATDNRAEIARRVLATLGARGERMLDICHNFVEETAHGLLHRKGAAPSDRGLVVLPGSRGARSWILRPKSTGDDALFSLAHGAGRRWKRSACEGRLKKKYSSVKQLERPKVAQRQSRVICKDRKLLYEEAPEAYKDVEVVVDALEEHGLITRVAALSPVLTYKTARA